MFQDFERRAITIPDFNETWLRKHSSNASRIRSSILKNVPYADLGMPRRRLLEIP
jgi:hypothetical protein